MKRDLSEAQFVAKVEKLGGKKSFMGYVEFRWDNGSKNGGNVSINRFNAGNRRRDQLRYLKRRLSEHVKRDAERAVQRELGPLRLLKEAMLNNGVLP